MRGFRWPFDVVSTHPLHRRPAFGVDVGWFCTGCVCYCCAVTLPLQVPVWVCKRRWYVDVQPGGQLQHELRVVHLFAPMCLLQLPRKGEVQLAGMPPGLLEQRDRSIRLLQMCDMQNTSYFTIQNACQSSREGGRNQREISLKTLQKP